MPPQMNTYHEYIILLVSQIQILCFTVVEGLVIIIIVASTLALKAVQLRQACRLGGTSTQPVLQPYGLCCLSGHVFNSPVSLVYAHVCVWS